MRTQEEILKRIDEVKDNDWMGTTRGDLMDFLTFENVKSFLKEDATEEDWNKIKKENNEETIKKEISDYLPFAWDKANNCRGLSSGRSIDHFSAWLWLLSQELYDEVENIEYEHYGKEKLVKISEIVGFDYKDVDNGIRTNTDY